MRGAGCVVKEEGLVRSRFLLTIDITDGFVGDLSAQVAAIGTDVSLIFHQVRFVLVGLRTQEPEEMVETLSGWPMIKWAGIGRLFVGGHAILADCKCVVAMQTKNFCNGSGRGRHPAIPAGEPGGENRVGESGNVHGCAVAASQQR